MENTTLKSFGQESFVFQQKCFSLFHESINITESPMQSWNTSNCLKCFNDNQTDRLSINLCKVQKQEPIWISNLLALFKCLENWCTNKPIIKLLRENTQINTCMLHTDYFVYINVLWFTVYTEWVISHKRADRFFLC